ncbi:hypothetical protein [Alkaliphilus hydrothermalis]|uniref:Uncharacterized protein n=1 Tax=Alkaliphilus hydrothermalis TaxID=1482730 RepID=A0ABS2NS19_9FIRM|nr:hypothetical protein [Alkaliphilus hydrothermalis]MBM7615745.1 hypothetical protein [Alkaliphilus hydrothermalis]
MRLREFEDTKTRNREYEDVKNQMQNAHTTKQSVMLILKGVIFAVILTVCEYVLRKYEIPSAVLRIVLRVGFFGSFLGLFYIPYGLHHLIKSLRQN